jgi:hypothetical protein
MSSAHGPSIATFEHPAASQKLPTLRERGILAPNMEPVFQRRRAASFEHFQQQLCVSQATQTEKTNWTAARRLACCSTVKDHAYAPRTLKDIEEADKTKGSRSIPGWASFLSRRAWRNLVPTSTDDGHYCRRVGLLSSVLGAWSLRKGDSQSLRLSKRARG